MLGNFILYKRDCGNMGIYTLGRMYLTMSPLLVGGVLNMIFTKTKLYMRLARPIDGGKCLRDGKRIFGDNKTIIGFVSMVVFCIIAQMVCGIMCSILKLEQHNDLYTARSNTLILNFSFGLMIGFIYMICELPNSFLKRRIDIPPGKTVSGALGFAFFILDQVDSLIGVMWLLCWMANLGFSHYLQYIIVGAFTHIAVNFLLFIFKIRRNV